MAIKTEQESKKEGGSNLNDFLQASKRKRKNYVFMALGEKFDETIATQIDAYIRRQYPQLAITAPKSPTEFIRMSNRNISLVLIDDEFAETELVFQIIKNLKEKRTNDVIPVIFLTRNQDELVRKYHEHLLAYQETDEFISYVNVPRAKLFSRLKNGIEAKNMRRSRRFNVDLPIQYLHLEQEGQFAGRILDISIHGCLLRTEGDHLFRLQDQLKLSIPTRDMLPIGDGEFLKLSARVRRVFISGDRVAASFEYMSERQVLALQKIIMRLSAKSMERKPNPTKPLTKPA